MNRIALHGVPRSGTTWLGSILDSSEYVAYRNQPLFSYKYKSYLNEHSSEKEINEFFHQLLITDDSFILQKEAKLNMRIPSFRKQNITHIVYKEARYHNICNNILKKDESIKLVGIIRNPKSVLSSWINAPKEFDIENWNVLKEWKYAESKNNAFPENFYGYYKWKEVAILFLKLKMNYSNRVFIVNYLDLLTDTITIVNSLFDFCKLPLTEQTLDFVTFSSQKDMSHDAYSVYRFNQKDNKWKDTLSEVIINEIDKDLKGTALEIFNK